MVHFSRTHTVSPVVVSDACSQFCNGSWHLDRRCSVVESVKYLGKEIMETLRDPSLVVSSL